MYKYRITTRKPMAQGAFENQPSGGDEVPTRLDSEGMRRSYDELCETTLTSASTLY
jgi:hypothetical protein